MNLNIQKHTRIYYWDFFPLHGFDFRWFATFWLYVFFFCFWLPKRLHKNYNGFVFLLINNHDEPQMCMSVCSNTQIIRQTNCNVSTTEWVRCLNWWFNQMRIDVLTLWWCGCEVVSKWLTIQKEKKPKKNKKKWRRMGRRE